MWAKERGCTPIPLTLTWLAGLMLLSDLRTMAQTSIHIEPVKGGSEQHNSRHKELDYIRKELTSLNESHIFAGLPGISETMAKIEADYKAAHNKKLHAKATPIREAVVVIEEGTSMEQLRDFCQKCQEKWGITPMQLYTHRDEGHQAETGWKANHHAHIVFCWYNFETHTTCKLSRADMAEMQTLLADCLQMERGVSSDKKHLSAIQQKNAAELAKLDKLTAQVAETGQAVVNAQQSADTAIRNCCKQLQAIGQHTVKNFDLLANTGAVKPTKFEQEKRDALDQEAHRDLSKSTGRELLVAETLLRNLIYHTGQAVERIGRKLQELAKGVPLLQLRKGRLAHEAELQARVEAADKRAANSMAEAENARKSAENAQSRANSIIAQAKKEVDEARINAHNREVDAQRREEAAQKREEEAKDHIEHFQKYYDNSYLHGLKKNQDEVNALKKEVEELKATKESWLKDFQDIAKTLINQFSEDSVKVFERVNLHEVIGTDIWNNAKEERQERLLRQQQEQQAKEEQSSGYRMRR